MRPARDLRAPQDLRNRTTFLGATPVRRRSPEGGRDLTYGFFVRNPAWLSGRVRPSPFLPFQAANSRIVPRRCCNGPTRGLLPCASALPTARP